MAVEWLKKLFRGTSSIKSTKEEIDLKNKNDLMEFRTSDGQQVYMEREEYRTGVLPHNIKINWDDPQELYNTIEGALRDDFYQDVLDAASRLLEVDPILERSHCIASIVFMKNNRVTEARELLEGYVRQYGVSDIILVNLAKTYDDYKKAEEILWDAMKLNPNLDHALNLFVAIQVEKEHKEYTEILYEISKLQNSWLAQLHIASTYLESKNFEKAQPLINHVLKNAPIESTALFGISGILGQNGYCKEVIEMVLPQYSYQVGFSEGVIHNILSSFYELKMPRKGLHFIRQVRKSFKGQSPAEIFLEKRIEEDLASHEKKFIEMTP